MDRKASHFIKFSGNFLIMLGLFIVCILILFGAANIAFSSPTNNVDTEAFNEVRSITNAGNTAFFQFITFFGGQKFLLPAWILIFIIFLAAKNLRHHFWKIAIVGIIGTLVMFGLKAFFERSRPEVPLISKAHGYSFPSGHSFSAVLFFGLISFFVYRSRISNPWKSLIIFALITLIVLIGISRVYLSVHYATDVIAGWTLGLIWLLLAKYILLDRRKDLDPENTMIFPLKRHKP